MSTKDPRATEKVLSFINKHQKRHGFPPTRVEICEHMGWSSTNSASYHINKLIKSGAIKVQPMVARGITL